MKFSELPTYGRSHVENVLGYETESWNGLDITSAFSGEARREMEEWKKQFFAFKMAILSEQDIPQAFMKWSGHAIDDFKSNHSSVPHFKFMQAYSFAERERERQLTEYQV